MKSYVGKTLINANGKEYVVLAQNGERALLMGGQDFVVINDISYFAESGSWGGGKYFPHFYDESQSVKSLDRALYFFNHYYYGEYEKDEEEINED